MSCIWTEVLSLVEICNQIIQKRDATLDVEVSNINELLKNLRQLHDKWEAKDLASAMDIEPQIPAKLTNSELTEEERILQCINGIEKRFKSTKKIVKQFDFLWT